MPAVEPPYQLLVQRLRETVGALPVGAVVPSERALSEESGVSRMTARRALAVLEREGLLVREVGRGTFVSRPAVTLPLRLTSFSEDMRARGRVPGSRLLRLDTAAAGTGDAARLGIEPGSPLVAVHRLRLADGRPFAIERTALVADVVPGIEAFDLAVESLYAILDREYGIHFDGGRQTIRAALATPADAALLELAAGDAVLQLDRTSQARGRIVEHTVSTYPGDRFELSAEIQPVTARAPADRSALRARD